MSYLSELISIQKAVDEIRIDNCPKYLSKTVYEEMKKKINRTKERIALSNLSSEDKEAFLKLVEKYEGNLQSDETPKYTFIALLFGIVGFGLGWYAKGAYEEYKENRAKEIFEIVKRKMVNK